jgi:hypothetical protein
MIESETVLEPDDREEAYFLTPAIFADRIEDIVWELDITHLEALSIYCERFELDLEDIKPLLNKPLIEKIEFDAQACGKLKKVHSLESFS